MFTKEENNKQLSKQEQIINRLKNIGLCIIGDYGGVNEIHTFQCIKNDKHKQFQRKISCIFKSLKKYTNHVPCSECRIDARIKFIEEQCPNLKLIEFHRQATATSRFYKIKWKCKHCNHEFYRTDDEVIRGGYQGCNDCPQCSYDRRKRLINNIFNSFEEYRKQVDNDTQWVNNIYTKFNNSSNIHIDHKCSVYDCYIHAIPVWICCSPINLCLLTEADNLNKSRKSSMTVDNLVLEFSKWLLEHQEYVSYIPKIKTLTL